MVDAKLLGAGVRKWLLLPVLAAVCGAVLLLWRLGCFLPRWIVWQEADCFCTAEEGPEQLSLRRKTLRAVSDGSEIWRSAAGQKVQSLLWCDIDHDGAPELLLLVWRWGRFGKSRPFWKPDRTGAGRSILIFTTGRERTFARPGWPRISVWMPPRGSLTNSSGLSSPNGADGKVHGTGSAGGLSELHNGIGAEQEE